MIREVCVENLAEALKAEELGADRIELCDNLAVGGTTPSLGTIIACKKYVKIPLMVMIRPRGGNYLYSAPEMETMLLDIRTCRDAGADGIVTGVLTPDSTIDMRALSQLVHSAGNLQITFHKAIDACREITQEIGLLRDSGIHRVLSSGGKQTALEGVDMLNDMIRLAAGKLIILAAGMITAENLTELSMLIHTDEFHGRKIAGDLAQCL